MLAQNFVGDGMKLGWNEDESDLCYVLLYDRVKNVVKVELRQRQVVIQISFGTPASFFFFLFCFYIWLFIVLITY